MTLRVAMMVLNALLLLVAVAGAATAPASSTPAVAPAAALGEPAACQISRASFGLVELAPAPTLLSGGLCGTCSLSPCQGANQGELCGFREGQYGYCQSPLGNNCSPTGLLKCQCWFGPLP